MHDGETVRLEISQEITNIVPEAPIGSAGFSDVVTSKRTIETSVLADDRQTIILGGLIQDDITINDSRVPFFGSIPAIGWLFRSESKSNCDLRSFGTERVQMPPPSESTRRSGKWRSWSPAPPLPRSQRSCSTGATDPARRVTDYPCDA